MVKQVLTQGRYAEGLGQEYAEAFTLQYWRPGMADFKGYRDSVGREVSGMTGYFKLLPLLHLLFLNALDWRGDTV